MFVFVKVFTSSENIQQLKVTLDLFHTETHQVHNNCTTTQQKHKREKRNGEETQTVNTATGFHTAEEKNTQNTQQHTAALWGK